MVLGWLRGMCVCVCVCTCPVLDRHLSQVTYMWPPPPSAPWWSHTHTHTHTHTHKLLSSSLSLSLNTLIKLGYFYLEPVKC